MISIEPTQIAGMILVVIALLGFILLLWKTNRALQTDLQINEQKTNATYRANDRYKQRIVLLESALDREQKIRQAGNEGSAALFGYMLLAEWGGFRLGQSPDKLSCAAVMHSPAGRLLFYYPAELAFRFETVPLKHDWDWSGAEHALLAQSQKHITDDLLAYAKSKLENDFADENDVLQVGRPVGSYQTDPIGNNAHDYARPAYEHATSTGVIRNSLTHEQITRACNIQMDDSSAQPVKAPRCMSCGVWTDSPCKPGGAIPTEHVVSTRLVQEPTHRVQTSPPIQDGEMIYVDVRRDPFDRSHVVGQHQTDPIGNNVHDFKPAQINCIGRDGEPDTYIDTSVSSDGCGGCD